MRAQRMYKVIVGGGVALVGGALFTTAVSCGGNVSPSPTPTTDSGAHDGALADTGFPQEGPALIDTGVDDTGFPAETAMITDTGVVDSGFPQEGPAQLDGGVDTGFPLEGPVPPDSGAEGG